MGQKIHTKWSLEISTPAETREWLGQGDAPAGDIRLLVDESPSESEKPYIEDSFLGYHLSKLLGETGELLNGNPIELDLDTSTLRFELNDELDAVEIHVDIHGVPDEVRNTEPDLIDKEAFVREIYQTGNSWFENAKEVNPELMDVGWFQDLERSLREAKQAIENTGISIKTDD